MVGAHHHCPAKWDDPEWPKTHGILGALRKGTLTRFDGLWHQENWDRNLRYGLENVRAKVQAYSVVGGPVIVGLTPIPWPGSWGWLSSLGSQWGYVDERETAQIAERFAWTVSAFRDEWKATGRKDGDLWFQIGNEPGATHPGGFGALPVGEWWDRHGRLYLACLRAARFGRAKVIGPALSFQDHDEETARREVETAAPILKAISRYLDFGAIHHRLYAPQFRPDVYADVWLDVLRQRRELVTSLTGLPTICTEAYVADMDTSNRAEALRHILSAEQSGITIMYCVGPSHHAPIFELPVSAFANASSESSSE